MGNWTKVAIVLIILSIGVAFGGYMFYRNAYRKPRLELEQKRAEIQQQIDGGKQMTQNMVAASAKLETLYTQSFPTNRTQAGLAYQMWLTQMLEFCNVKDAKVVVGNYSHPRNSGNATQMFRVQAQCSLLDLTQFLYEFYWTPFLHRITALDISPQENSDLLNVAMTIEGLTILFKANPKQAFPLVDKLPLAANPTKRLSSGPFAAYRQMGNSELFRAVRTGVDSTSFALLTGVPVITGEDGVATKFARWNLEAEGRTINLKIGERMQVGAFDATIVDIDDNLVVLKQNTGRLWAVALGNKLSEAVAIPNNLF